MLVLETLASARARGARPLALLAGAGASCDAHHMTAPDPSGAGVARAVRAALADAALTADDIAFVNAHGTGTPLNDAAEWRALSAVFGARARRLPVTSTKGSVGHFLGSAGAIEAVATVLGLERRRGPPDARRAARSTAPARWTWCWASRDRCPRGARRAVGELRLRRGQRRPGLHPRRGRRRRVTAVVTGLGAVGAFGAGRRASAAALGARRAAPDRASTARRATTAAAARGPALARWATSISNRGCRAPRRGG